MSPDERQMISGLFDRMRGMGQIDKDRDAEALINQSVRQNPDAAYMLVQSVLVQEHALQQAGARIEELEEQVRQLEHHANRAPAQASGGFLGGLFGGGARPQPAPAPAANYARPAAQQGYGQPMQPQRGGSPWGQQPMGQQPMGQAAPAGGGFMRTAMATAAGVAGGMLLANSISGMMGGNSGSAQAASNDQAAADDSASQQASYADPSANDPGMQDAGFDADTDWGAGGDDMEI